MGTTFVTLSRETSGRGAWILDARRDAGGMAAVARSPSAGADGQRRAPGDIGDPESMASRLARIFHRLRSSWDGGRMCNLRGKGRRPRGDRLAPHVASTDQNASRRRHAEYAG